MNSSAIEMKIKIYRRMSDAEIYEDESLDVEEEYDEWRKIEKKSEAEKSCLLGLKMMKSSGCRRSLRIRESLGIAADTCHNPQEPDAFEPSLDVVKSKKPRKPDKKATNLHKQQVNLEPYQVVVYACTHCNATFNKLYSLNRHFKLHTGLKPFPCRFCEKRFIQKSDRDRHEAVHIGNKQFVCEICDKGFVTKKNLQSHLIVHRIEKPHQCMECSKLFKTELYLKRHQKVHSKCKNYKCAAKGCGKTFIHKSLLESHSICHTSKREFVCVICLAAYKRKNDLRSHARTHIY